jgi:Flp pilus assembly protein TadB
VSSWLAGVLFGLALLLAAPHRPRLPPGQRRGPMDGRDPPEQLGWLLRRRGWWSACVGLGAGSFVWGRWGLVAGVVATVLAWWAIGRTEPLGVRRHREAQARDLPAVVHLLAAALATGADVSGALRLVCGSFPGPAADVLAEVPPRLELGLEVDVAWRPVLERPALAPLARSLVRASRSGAPVGSEVERLARDLHERARSAIEERARTVGVRAAVPLGLCLLPSFVIVGVVPVAAGLLDSLAL